MAVIILIRQVHQIRNIFLADTIHDPLLLDESFLRAFGPNIQTGWNPISLSCMNHFEAYR